MNKHLDKHLQNTTWWIWKVAIASMLSWEIAKIAGSHHPYLAPLSVILCLQTTINRSIQFSYHRMVGTVIGISVTVLIAPYLMVNGWTIGLLLLIGCFIAKWLKRDDIAIHQAALTVLLVFVMGHKGGNYPMDRFRDTLIGAVIAVVLHMLVFPPNFTKQAAKQLNHFTEHLTSSFSMAAEWVQSGAEKQTGTFLQKETKKLLQDLHQTNTLINDARESLKYNPFAKKSKGELKGFQQRIYYLTQGYLYLSSTIQTFQNWSAIGNINPNQQLKWGGQLKVFGEFFQINENPSVHTLLGERLMVTIPKEVENLQFHVSIYYETINFIKKMNELPKSNG
ncbi:MAG TPA: FUSC family protein [Neobacillus sp.]|jgi:uncharacterized membrane protein YgaE (UPF0421/DUF939 family)